MTDQNTTNSADADIDDSSRRSSAYPSKDHQFIVNLFVPKIYSELGHNSYHSREAIAAIHGLAPNTIRNFLATAQYFGLLDLKRGVGYKVTPLFIKIFRPINEKERREAIIESLRNPILYNDLFNDFENHVVPTTGLANNLIRRYGIVENVAPKVADVFLQSLKDYGILNSYNILSVSGFINQSGVAQGTKEAEGSSAPIEHEKPKTLNHIEPKGTQEKDFSDLIDIIIPLKSTSVKAHLLLPENYTEEDLGRIARFVEALK